MRRFAYAEDKVISHMVGYYKPSQRHVQSKAGQKLQLRVIPSYKNNATLYAPINEPYR